MGKRTCPILVTGGAGFVGSALVRELLDQNSDAPIVVLDNLFNGKVTHLPDSPWVTFRDVDLRDARAVLETFQEVQPKTVYHLAALHFIPYCNGHPAETMQVNVVGTQNVLEACRAYQPDRLVIASTAAVYPIREGAITEDQAAGPTDIYGLSKWVNERQLELYSRQTDTRCAAARLFNAFGPRETNPHVIPEILDQMVRGVTEIAIGNVKPKRDYVYTSDIAKALITIAEKHSHSFRVYNVGTGQEHSVEEVLERLADISGMPLRFSVEPNRVRASDRLHLLCDRSRMAQELGWVPEHTLESGLVALWQFVSREAAQTQLQTV